MSSGNSRSRSERAWAVWLLVGLPVVVHALTGALLWSLGEDAASAWWWERSYRWRLTLGGQAAGPVAAGQWWRLVTSTQLHVSGWHVLWNTLGLGALCAVLLRRVGVSRLCLWFAVGAVGASVASQLLGVAQSDGASGGVLAVLGAGVGWGARRWRGLDASTRRLVGPVLGLLLVAELLMPVLWPSSTDTVAHGAGALIGAGMGLTTGEVARWRRATNWSIIACYTGLLAYGFVQAWRWAS